MQCDICSATATAPAKGLCREDATSPGSLSHGDGGDVGAVGGEDGGSLSTGAAAPLCVTQGLSPGGGDVPWVHSSWGWGHLSPNRAEEQWTQFRAGLTLPSMWVQHCTALQCPQNHHKRCPCIAVPRAWPLARTMGTRQGAHRQPTAQQGTSLGQEKGTHGDTSLLPGEGWSIPGCTSHGQEEIGDRGVHLGHIIVTGRRMEHLRGVHPKGKEGQSNVGCASHGWKKDRAPWGCTSHGWNRDGAPWGCTSHGQEEDGDLRAQRVPEAHHWHWEDGAPWGCASHGWKRDGAS